MLSESDLMSKIYEDELIEHVLEALGCHSIHIEQRGCLYVAARPDGDNRRSVQVKNDYGLYSKILTRNVSGDLLEVVKYIKEFDYISQAKDWLIEVCGYSDDSEYEAPPLLWLDKIKRQRKYYEFVYDLPALEDDALNQYIHYDIAQFLDDGISKESLRKFKVGYDTYSKRITIPIYDIHGNLCGVKGRTTVKEDEAHFKFFFLYPCDQSKTLYNYFRVKDYQSTEVKVFEAEKAAMQMDSMGIYDVVGIGSKNVSRYQLELLLKLDRDIILCPDDGVIMEEFCQPFIDYFDGKRNVYLIDGTGILPKKSAPSDCGIEVWNKLYENKRRICGI